MPPTLRTSPEPAADETAAQPGSAQSVGALILAAAARHRGVALQFTRRGRDAYLSPAELGTAAAEIARGLIALGIEAGDRVAILGISSPSWTLADCGTLCAGAVTTPIYHTNSAEECAYVLAHSGARLVFCEDAEQAAKVAHVADRCPALEHVVLFAPGAHGELTLEQLRSRGGSIPPAEVDRRLAAVTREDLATLVYTSGTTGPPKGCMLTHGNLLATVRMYGEELALGETHSIYLFLPLAHVLARIAQFVALSVGARIIYWTGDATRIAEELERTGPTHFPGVPRVFEKIHGVVLSRVSGRSRAERALFGWALRCGAECRRSLRAGQLPSLVSDVQFRLADRLVLAQIRSAFGPHLQVALVGAAPIARELLEFFDACGVLVLEGYGLSETCAAATLNTVDAVRFGTVGKALPGAEVSLAADGEILLRGPHVFHGYFRDPEATAEALGDDGWLRTGDLGSIDADGFVRITGRRKDLIITSSGKNVTPVNIESELRESRYITEAVVYGDSRPYLVAMLALDRDEAVKLAERLGIRDEPAAIAADPGVHREIQREVDAVNARFARIEQIKRFAILDHDLSQAAGELTPTLKVKRAAIYEKYRPLFAALYEEEDR